MRYISLSSMFPGIKQAPFDKKAIQLGRKQLLAELELNGGDSIGIKGIAFTKNDIIGYFEELQQDNITDYHRAVDEDDTLRSFLEEAFIDEGQRFRDNNLYRDDRFIGWISAYFYASFTTFADNCFENTGDIGLETMLGNSLLMTAQDTERAWQYISRILAENMTLLNEYRRQDKKKKEILGLDKVSHILQPAYIKMILLLPANRFGDLRDKLAFGMMQALIYAFNRHIKTRFLVVTCLESAISLPVSEEISAELSAKLKEMNGIISRSKKKYIWRVAVLVVIILSGIRGAFDSSNPETSLQNAPVYIVTPKDSTLPADTIKHRLTPQAMDSIFKRSRIAPLH